jgi:hypothetical protein
MLEEELVNVRDGSLVKASSEIIYEKKQTKKEIILVGKIIIIREIKNIERITEIKDSFPIDITIFKEKVINPESEVLLHLTSVKFEVMEDKTIFQGEIELSNIEEKTKESVFND